MIPRIFRCVIVRRDLVATAAAGAQETRGTITGHVLDEQGGAMPGVSVTITNVDTNVSNDADDQFDRLLPGSLVVAGELPGDAPSCRASKRRFAAASSCRSPSRRRGPDARGGCGQRNGHGDAARRRFSRPASLTTGQNLDRRSVESLPMFANMPVLLTRFVAGVNSSADVPYVAQGFVNRTSSDTSSPGGVGGNEWTIDGATNNGSDRRLASSPNSDMIEEVRIETANFDASFGHSTGLGISMMTRSGTNLMRGIAELPVLEQPVERAEVFREEELLRQHRAGARARRRGAGRFAGVAENQPAREIQQPREHLRRPDHQGQALRVRELFLQQRRPAGEPDPAHDSDRGESARRLLGSARDRSCAVSDLRSAERQARSRAARVLHPRSVSRATSFRRTGSSTRCTSTTSSFCRRRTTTRRIPRRSRRTTIWCEPTPTRSRARSTARASTTTSRIRTGSSAGGAAATSPKGSTTGRIKAPRIHSEDMKRTTQRGDRQLDVDQERDDGHRRAGERQCVFRGRRSGDAGRHQDRPMSGCPAYLDEKCAASDEARVGSTRGGSCALPIVNLGRAYQTFGKNAAQRDTTR